MSLAPEVHQTHTHTNIKSGVILYFTGETSAEPPLSVMFLCLALWTHLSSGSPLLCVMTQRIYKEQTGQMLPVQQVYECMCVSGFEGCVLRERERERGMLKEEDCQRLLLLFTTPLYCLCVGLLLAVCVCTGDQQKMM